MGDIVRGPNYVIVKSEALKENTNNIIDIYTKMENASVIFGRVNMPDGCAATKSIIEIVEIDRCNNGQIIGYAFTDEKGEYRFAIDPKVNRVYEIKVYMAAKEYMK